VSEVLVARVGSAARVDRDAKREACMQLEAFMGSAEPGTVLVSEATRPFLERRFVVSPFASDGAAGKAYRLAGLGRTALGLGEPRDDVSKIRERVTEKVLSLEGALAPTLSPILALLDVPVDDAPWDALDPAQKQRRTLEAVKLLLLEESRLRPVTVLFEDLHWIDSKTQAVLETLVESVPSHRVLLLVSYRPEYHHTWGGKSYFAQLRLDPLSPENAYALLDSLLGREVATAAVKAVLIERTGGNPFFLEESVRAAVETGVLVG